MHYGTPLYWEMEQQGLVPGQGQIISQKGRQEVLIDERSGTVMIGERVPEAQNLFSLSDLMDFDVQAKDGNVGKIDDFIIDDSTWDIRYAVIDASKLESGKKVLISPRWIDRINEPDSEMHVNLTQDAIKNSPAYDPNRPIDARYEKSLFDYYYRGAAPFPYSLWRFDHMLHTTPNGRKLRIEVRAPAVVHWSADNWKTSNEIKTRDSGKGTHIAELPIENVQPGNSVHFTFFWPQAKHWEGKNFSVRVSQLAGARERAREMAGVGR
jgi:hypothetical protein